MMVRQRTDGFMPDFDDLRRMNVGRRYSDMDPAKICASAQPMIMRYIERVYDMWSKGLGMTLWGEYRAGKTAAAVCAMVEIMAHKGTSYMLDANQMTSAWIDKKAFDEDETVQERSEGVDLLVIDDLGLGLGKSDFARQIVEALIRKRVCAVKPTLITSNLPVDSLMNAFGEGLSRVVHGYFMPVEFQGKRWDGFANKTLRGEFLD